MKTLNEVINIFEKACDLERRCEGCSGCLGQEYGCPNDGAESVPDALFYLKEYRFVQENCADALAEKYPSENVPLTWDELKTMTGKPVWVEYGIGFNQKRWVVIHSIHNTKSFCYMNVSGNYPDTFWQKDMGENEFWQAYRKERRE